jgi:hypothetical protein
MMETQKTISEWGFKTFGYPKSPVFIIDRLLKEVDELKDLKEQAEKYNDLVYSKIADECADIHIMLCQVMAVLGYDLPSCVNHKMEINRGRKWEVKGDGTGQHIKG